MTVLEVIKRSTDFLTSKGVESPRLQIELMLAHVLKMPRLQLYLDFERIMPDAELDSLRSMVRRRANREPLQHILGSVCFCGLEIQVNRDVLIPRPETELLAERGWTFLQRCVTPDERPLAALDFGTGSGCLALALASHHPTAIIVALDISEQATRVARDNALRLGLADRIRFMVGNAFEAVAADWEKRFDLIISNPPYITSEEIKNLAPEVRDHDPLLALDGGPDGLMFYRLLAQDGGRFLSPTGEMMMEIGDGQAQAIRNVFESTDWLIHDVYGDYSGRDRIMTVKKAVLE